MGRRAKPVKAKAEAKRPLARKSPKDDAARVRDLEKRLAAALEELRTSNRERAEAHDQQTATSEILRVIASSPTELQPVFDALAHSARRLLGGHTATVRRLIGDEMRLLAFTATASDARPITSRRVSYDREVVDERRPVVIEDIETDARVSAGTRERARARGWRSVIVVPMFRDEVVLGTITVTRSDPGPFSRDEIAVLQTFADQAVIAIENRSEERRVGKECRL